MAPEDRFGTKGESVVARRSESFRTLDQLKDGGMLQDNIIVLLGDCVAQRFFEWVGQECCGKYSAKLVRVENATWECVAVYLPHPIGCQFNLESRARFIQLISDVLEPTCDGQVSQTYALLESQERRAFLAAEIADYLDFLTENELLEESSAEYTYDDDDIAREIEIERVSIVSYHLHRSYSHEELFED